MEKEAVTLLHEMTKKTLMLIGVLLELLLVFGLFVPYEYMLARGTEITLRTVPVDPRSIFRGDYVVLGYEIGQELPVTEYGKTMYFVLEQHDDIYERIGYSYEKPDLTEGQVCIRGVSQYRSASFPDIAQYFVEEDTGKQFEEARNTHRLLVNVVVNDDCNAIIRSVVLGPEAPLENPDELDFLTRPIPESVPSR